MQKVSLNIFQDSFFFFLVVQLSLTIKENHTEYNFQTFLGDTRDQIEQISWVKPFS